VKRLRFSALAEAGRSGMRIRADCGLFEHLLDGGSCLQETSNGSKRSEKQGALRELRASLKGPNKLSGLAVAPTSLNG
jgi:hypothetical protein